MFLSILISKCVRRKSNFSNFGKIFTNLDLNLNFTNLNLLPVSDNNSRLKLGPCGGIEMHITTNPTTYITTIITPGKMAESRHLSGRFRVDLRVRMSGDGCSIKTAGLAICGSILVAKMAQCTQVI